MPLVSRLGAASSRGFGEFNQQAAGQYIEDYFSTYLYTGNGTTKTINNGIALANTASWYSLVGYNVNSWWSAGGVVADNSGNIYSSNTIYNVGSVTTKFTSSGTTTWQRQISGIIQNGVYKNLAVSSSGNVAFVGSGNTPYLFGYVAVYNSSGVLQWQKSVSSTNKNNALFSCAFDSSGNLYVAGYSLNVQRPCLIKFDSSGNFVWQKNQLNSSYNLANASSVVVDSSDNVYFSTTNFVGGYNQTVLAKYNSSGTLLWGRAYSASSENITLNSSQIDGSDNIYLCTGSRIFKINSSGTLVWKKSLSLGGPQACTIDSSGNVYIAAYNYLVALNSSGIVQWAITSSNYGFQNITNYGGNLYVSSVDTNTGTYEAIVVIAADGTANQGSAQVSIQSASVTTSDATTVSESGSTGMTDDSTNSTISTSTNTDSAGSTTYTKYTQAAITGAGGLVWTKSRSSAYNHQLYDTSRGATKSLFTNLTDAELTLSTGLTAFGSTGYTLGANGAVNNSADTYASWTFRKAPKFFDIVTYTGTGSTQAINHNLGAAPGMIIIKSTSIADGWAVYHSSLGPTKYLWLQLTNAQATSTNFWNNTAPTSTQFTVQTNSAVNQAGATYVAYLFAHDAGGFGADGSQNVISCGSFVYDSTNGNTVNLGYEPQFVLMKDATGTSQWYMQDIMRGMTAGPNSGARLVPNQSAAEDTSFIVGPTATGFVNKPGFWTNGDTIIYMAIRRGPMRTPTSGTSVFYAQASTYSNGLILNTGFPADLTIINKRFASFPHQTIDRLRGGAYQVQTNSTMAEAGPYSGVMGFDSNTSVIENWSNQFGNGGANMGWWNFARAPGFFDVVCYTGTGTDRTVSHNLTVKPEFIFIKNRTTGTSWVVYNKTVTATGLLSLNSNGASTTNPFVFLNTEPTSSVFTVGAATSGANESGANLVAYLFASCPGVSKVGSYTGTGATQTIDCGFTGGARYVLIKRTDSTGDWWVWDTARGMVAGTDPRSAYNLPDAETNANWVYTTTGGFQIVTSDATVNANGGSYIYLAIA